MSHDLEFATSPGSEERSRSTFLARLEEAGWRPDPEDGGHLYQNRSTGVTATLEEAEPSEFERVVSLGLYLGLAYVRPSFWGAEVLPAVARAAGAAGLRIADPQSKLPGDNGEPAIREAEDLIDSWTAGNRWAIEVIGKDVPRMAPEHALYWWHYQRARPELENRIKADVFVPNLQPARRGGEMVALRQVAWLNAMPILLPQCDVVIFGRGRDRASVVHAGIASYDEVRAVIGPYLEPIKITDEIGAEILWPDAAARVAEQVLAMKLRPRGSLANLPFDGFVDV